MYIVEFSTTSNLHVFAMFKHAVDNTKNAAQLTNSSDTDQVLVELKNRENIVNLTWKYCTTANNTIYTASFNDEQDYMIFTLRNS
jgi:hypothetical protein